MRPERNLSTIGLDSPAGWSAAFRGTLSTAAAAAAGAAAVLVFGVMVGLLVRDWEWVAVVVLVPPILTALQRRPGAAVRWAPAYATAAAVGGFSWVARYDPLLFAVVVLALTLLLGGFLALVALLARRVHPAAAAVVPALTWCGALILTDAVGLGSYWFDLAIFRPRSALLPWSGPLGVTFLLLLANGALAVAVARRRWRGAVVGAAVWLVTVAVLALPVPAAPTVPTASASGHGHGEAAEGGPLRVGVAQGNFGKPWEWRQRHAGNPIFLTYADLTLEAERLGADVVIWPEYAVPVDVARYNPALRQHLDELSAGIAPRLVFGTILVDEETGDHRDSALVFHRGEPIDEYSSVAPAFFNRNTVAGDVPPRPLRGLLGGAVVICFEETQSALFRQAAAAGAEWFVSLANPQGFGPIGEGLTGRFSQLRAAETGRSVVRSTNTGQTTVVAPDGRVVASAPRGRVALLMAEVPAARPATPYVRFGGWPMLAVLGLLGLGCVVTRPSARRVDPPGEPLRSPPTPGP